MNTLQSLTKRLLRGLAASFASLWLLLPGTSLFAQQTMSLGDLSFVLPDANASLASRTLRYSLSSSSVSLQDLNLVGGIAFTQTAIADFPINSSSIYFSKIEQTAHLVLNGQDIPVPLDLFELQPIVNFANSDKNVVITRYGERYGAIHQRRQSAEILYHPAFVDKILGLRLLQVDVLGELSGKNYEFPSIDGKLLMTEAEKNRLQELEERAPYYKPTSLSAFLVVASLMSTYLGEKHTFVYTDVNVPIHFSLEDDKLSFTGLPYYLFGKVVEGKVDELSFYSYYKGICNSELKIINQMTDPPSSDKKLRRLFREGFKKIDAQKDKSPEQKASELLQGMYDDNSPVCQAYIEYFSRSWDAILWGWKYNAEDLPKQFPVYEEVPELTDKLKGQPDLIRLLNPIVYEEVDSICRWAAVFRHIKEQSPSTWKQFVTTVNAQKMPPPAVKTPVSIQRPHVITPAEAEWMSEWLKKHPAKEDTSDKQ